MVVEHSFVTTLPGDESMKKASEFLSRGGFVAETQAGFALDRTAWTTLNVRRGKTTRAASLAIPDLPQQVHIEWDRGRVTVAASIRDQHSAKKRKELLLTIVTGVESALVKGQSEYDSTEQWTALDASLRRSGRWYKYRRYLIIAPIILIWVAVFFFFLRR